MAIKPTFFTSPVMLGTKTIPSEVQLRKTRNQSLEPYSQAPYTVSGEK